MFTPIPYRTQTMRCFPMVVMASIHPHIGWNYHSINKLHLCTSHKSMEGWSLIVWLYRLYQITTERTEWQFCLGIQWHILAELSMTIWYHCLRTGKGAGWYHRTGVETFPHGNLLARTCGNLASDVKWPMLCIHRDILLHIPWHMCCIPRDLCVVYPVTYVLYTPWPMCCIPRDLCVVYPVTYVLYTPWPMCCIPRDLCVVYPVTYCCIPRDLLLHTPWPMCCIPRDLCVVYPVTYVRHTPWPMCCIPRDLWSAYPVTYVLHASWPIDVS